jgi:hypothetical protein
MRTVIAWMVMLTALAGGWSVRACADGVPAAQNSGQVTVEGDLHEGTRVATSGANVPLRTALRLIVPADFSINLPNAGAWAATPVTWQQGKPLVQTLRDALAGHPELIAQVDGDFQLVTIRYRQPFDARPAAQTMSEGIVRTVAQVPAQTAVQNAAQSSAQTVPPMVAPTTVAVPAPAMPKTTQTAQPVQAHTVTPASLASQTVAASAASDNAPHSASTKNAGASSEQSHLSPTHAAQATQADRTSALAEPAQSAQTQTPTVTPPPLPVQQTWRIEPSDRTVRAALTRWAQEAGWQLVWEAPTDFSVDAAATVHGTFDEALQQVVSALAHSNAPVQAILYQGNKVLRIVAKGAA